jgi:hypothetical protein
MTKTYDEMTDAEKYHHELPQYRQKLIVAGIEREDILRLVCRSFNMLTELIEKPELANDVEWKIDYKHLDEAIDKWLK